MLCSNEKRGKKQVNEPSDEKKTSLEFKAWIVLTRAWLESSKVGEWRNGEPNIPPQGSEEVGEGKMLKEKLVQTGDILFCRRKGLIYIRTPQWIERVLEGKSGSPRAGRTYIQDSSQ